MSHKSSLLLFLFCLFTFWKAEAQETSQIVTGTVKDRSGNPLPDITISEKGRSHSVATNSGGAFRISVSGANAVIEITGVGFATQEVKASGSNLSIVLDQTTEGLQEVTVVGYSTKKREQISSAVSVVSGEK